VTQYSTCTARENNIQLRCHCRHLAQSLFYRKLLQQHLWKYVDQLVTRCEPFVTRDQTKFDDTHLTHSQLFTTLQGAYFMYMPFQSCVAYQAHYWPKYVELQY